MFLFLSIFILHLPPSLYPFLSLPFLSFYSFLVRALPIEETSVVLEVCARAVGSLFSLLSLLFLFRFVWLVDPVHRHSIEPDHSDELAEGIFFVVVVVTSNYSSQPPPVADYFQPDWLSLFCPFCAIDIDSLVIWTRALDMELQRIVTRCGRCWSTRSRNVCWTRHG